MAHSLHSIFTVPQVDDVRLDVRVLGHLAHRGEIVARDPLAGEAEPFAERFPPGRHRVEVLVHRRGGSERNDERVALARVVFADGEPDTFELAIRRDEDVRMLAPGEVFGYGVDAGTGCFATPEASASVDGDALFAELARHRRLTWCWAAMQPHDGGHELFAFSSGYGDGTYASYIGRAADGSALCLVTDFALIELALPTSPDDPPFRKEYATQTYERLKRAVPLLGSAKHGHAYRAASYFVRSPGDAAHLAEHVIADLRDAPNELERDLFRFVLGRLLVAPAIQRVFAAHLPTLDRVLIERLLVTPSDVDPALFTAVADLWSRDDRALRAWFLDLGLRAKQLTSEQWQQLLARAIEALGSGERKLAEQALVVLERRAAHEEALPHEVIASIRDVARQTGELRTKRRALRILQRSGVDLSDELASPDATTRLAAAHALAPEYADHARTLYRAIAFDQSLPVELRREAAHAIDDDEVKVAVFTELAFAGDDNAAGELRWVMTTDAMQALERLAAEAPAQAVRTIAAHVLEQRRDVEAMKQQQWD